MSWFFSVIVRNSLRSRRRSLLTFASVAVSLCLLAVLLAMSRALFWGSDQTPGQALRLVVHHKIAPTQDLPVSDEPKIEGIQGVRSVTSLRWFGGTYKDPRDLKNRFAQFAIEPQKLFDVYPELRIAEDEKRTFISQKTACVASRDLAEALGWKRGERITLVGTLFPATLELTLAGILDGPSAGSVLYLNRDYLRDSLPPNDIRRDMVQQYYIEADSQAAVAAVAHEIDAVFADSPYPTKTEPEQAFMLSFVSFLGNLKLFLAVICGAVTFTILLVSANMLSMSVRDRTREIGILKTLGFSSLDILGMVAGEATIITVSGGTLGCVFAWGICTAIGGAMKHASGFASVIQGLRLTPIITSTTLLTAIFIGLASSIVPGLNAARTSILDALGYSG